MARPSVDDVADALGVLGALVDDEGGSEEERALRVLAAAAVPRDAGEVTSDGATD